MTVKLELLTTVRSLITQARERAVSAVDAERVLLYWHIGQVILEEEQHGADRAAYGSRLIKGLAAELQPQFGSIFEPDYSRAGARLSSPPFFTMALRLTSLRAAAALLALSSLVACSKKTDDTPTPTPAPAAQGMSWTVDGANVTAASATANVLSLHIDLIGATTGTSMGVRVPKRAGTFAVGAGANDATPVYNVNSASPTAFFGTSGTVVVTTYTPSTTAGASHIVGTFNFTGTTLVAPTATKAITNGKFDLKY